MNFLKGGNLTVHAKQDDATLDVKALQELGDTFLTVEDYQQAQQCYERAAVISPDDAAPYVGMGIAAMRTEHPEQAELAFRVACRLDPSCARAYEGLGKVAQQEHNYEKAFEMYLKCLELDTNNLTALLGLFQASAQMGSFAKIIHYLEIYLKSHPDDGSVMFSLATLYIKEDRFEEARTILLKLLSVTPDNQDAANLLEELEQKLNHTMAP